ncbi:MAG: alpha/beta hydrolase [Lysobacter sp.]|nr:alpha/beta hydrolase [Lysobacter sp.]
MTTAPPLEYWIDTPQGRLYARRWRSPAGYADLPPIVLFHDSLGCVELWRDYPERLAYATGREVVAYDRLGFGRSDPHPDRLRADFIHDEARVGFAHVREQLGIGEFIAFGHSVGGGMAVGVAAAYPEHCRALITESAQAFVEDRTLAGIRAAKLAFAQPGQVERLQRYHGDKAAWALSAWIDTWLAPEFADWSLDDDLRQVHCPVLALHGDGDEFGSARHPERIVALSAGPSTMQLLEGCGHVPHRERADGVLDIVVRWLSASAQGV